MDASRYNIIREGKGMVKYQPQECRRSWSQQGLMDTLSVPHLTSLVNVHICD